MSNVSIGIPFITSAAHSEPGRIVRRFQGDIEKTNSVAHVAGIVRRALEREGLPENARLLALRDEELVQLQKVARRVPDEVWAEGDLFPVSDWLPWPG